jgi:hypothetical protein
MLSYALNACKTLINYGTNIRGSTFDPSFSQGFISSKPNVSLIGSSCFIDYTGSFNISDLTYLKKLFKNTPVGTTFAFSDASYYDPNYEYTVDPSGVFRFESLTGNDKLIVGGVQSGFTSLTNYKFYNANNFVNAPQYSSGYSGGATAHNYIENNLTINAGKSFISLGIIGNQFGKEEYVEVSGSSTNTGKLKIDSVIKLKDNRELVYLTSTAQNENLAISGITYTHYLRGNANPEILSKSRRQIGCYVVYDSLGNQISCFENQNQLQAFLRSQYETSTYTAEWVPSLSCSRLYDIGFNASTADKALPYDASVFVYIDQFTAGNYDPSGNYNESYVYLLKTNNGENGALQVTSELNFTIDTGFKIDLSHPSLKGFAVNYYTDAAKSVPMTENIYLLGVPGFDQSGILYTKTETSSRSIYIELVGPTLLGLQVTVQ